MSGIGLFRAVRRVLQLQALVIAVASGLGYALGGRAVAVSVLLGGLIGFLPNAYFSVKFGRNDPTRSASEVVRAFYVGETVKLLITALLFVLAFHLPGIAFMPLFIGFVTVIMVFWFALLLHN